MVITDVIEYAIINGNISIEQNQWVDDTQVEFVNVEFNADPCWEDDGIGSYEYWGSKSYDSQPYISCERYGINFDKEKYNNIEVEVISKYIEKNYNKIENKFVENFKYEWEILNY